MAYRSGTYVAFHAAGNSNPTASDMRYYTMLTAWHKHDAVDFRMVNSHEKSAAMRDGVSKDRLKVVLAERLRNSRNMVLVIGETTRFDDDWVPWEIAYAVDRCKIPIIAAYTAYSRIQSPHLLAHLWPKALAERIDSRTARVIHVPFKRSPLKDAIAQFDHDNCPGTGLDFYSNEAYEIFDRTAPLTSR